MLIFQIKIIVSSEKWFNFAVTFFGGEMPKISAGRTTLSLLHSRLVGEGGGGGGRGERCGTTGRR